MKTISLRLENSIRTDKNGKRINFYCLDVFLVITFLNGNPL